MSWFLVVNDDTGDLVSETGSDPSGFLEPPLIAIELVERPDYATKVWNPATRSLEDRPAAIFLSRLDDYESWFQNQPEFPAVWNRLRPNDRDDLRAMIRRGVQKLIGAGNVYRHPDEPWDAGDDIR